jgi:hypothetical protein
MVSSGGTFTLRLFTLMQCRATPSPGMSRVAVRPFSGGRIDLLRADSPEPVRDVPVHGLAQCAYCWGREWLRSLSDGAVRPCIDSLVRQDPAVNGQRSAVPQQGCRSSRYFRGAFR